MVAVEVAVIFLYLYCQMILGAIQIQNIWISYISCQLGEILVFDISKHATIIFFQRGKSLLFV